MGQDNKSLSTVAVRKGAVTLHRRNESAKILPTKVRMIIKDETF